MKGTIKKIVSLTLIMALALSSVILVKKEASAKNFNACLVFQTTSFFNRDGLDASNHGDCIKQQSKEIEGTSCKDAVISGKKGTKTYTVSITGFNKLKYSDSELFNLLYVDTDLENNTKKYSITNMVVKFDGKTVKTIKKPFITDKDGADNLQGIAVNTYNEGDGKGKLKWHPKTKQLPKKSIEITFDVTIK